MLFAKDPEGVSEYVNDINGELINFWNVLKYTPDRMLRYLWATPLSKDLFTQAVSNLKVDDRLMQATNFFVRNRQSRQGLGKEFCTPTSRTRRGMNENVAAWLSAIEGLPEVHARLKRVEIRNQDACKLIRELDSPETLYFCDPPYLKETRVAKKAYGECEMSKSQHIELLMTLRPIKGKFLLCGYRNELYDNLAEMFGWHRVDFEIDNKASSQKIKPKKVESVWANYEIQAA